MKKYLSYILCMFLLVSVLAGCKARNNPKIAVAFGVGPATRWKQEMKYMEEYSKSLGISFEGRMNTDEVAKPLAQDCYELIDSGIDVLIILPRDVNNLKAVVEYAHKRKVKIISYDSLIETAPVDLFVGYDSKHTGQILGQYVSEIVTSGNYILLWGDMNHNVQNMYDGAMKSLGLIKNNINIILEAGVPGWSSEEAKRIVKEAIIANNNQIDAIIAFNDSLAGACAEAIKELGITTPVAITGMDAQLDAVKRIVDGTQICSAYMDLKALSNTTIDLAIQLAEGKEIASNTNIDNANSDTIPSYLLSRQLVTKMNLDKVLIESKFYTEEEIYGEASEQ